MTTADKAKKLVEICLHEAITPAEPAPVSSGIKDAAFQCLDTAEQQGVELIGTPAAEIAQDLAALDDRFRSLDPAKMGELIAAIEEWKAARNASSSALPPYVTDPSSAADSENEWSRHRRSQGRSGLPGTRVLRHKTPDSNEY